MVTVPKATYNVQADALKNAYQTDTGATAAAFGAEGANAMGQAGALVQRAGNNASDLITNILHDDNVRTAKDLDTQFAQQLQGITYGDGSPDNPGYYGLSGQAAINGYDGAVNQIADAQKAVVAQAPNKAVRQMIEAQANARVLAENDGMLRHQSQQRQVASDATSTARIGQAASDVFARYNDDTAISAGLEIARNEAVAQSKNPDGSPRLDSAQFQASIQAAQSTVALSAIDGAMTNDLNRAKQLYATYGDMMTPKQRAGVLSDFKTQERAQRADAAQQRMLAKQAQADSVDAAANEWTTKILDNPGQPIDYKALAADKRLASNAFVRGQILAFGNTVQREQAEGPLVTPAVSARNLVNIIADISRPEGDPQKITSTQQIQQDYIDGKINYSDRASAMTELTNGKNEAGATVQQQLNDVFSGVKSTITKSAFGGQSDGPGDLKYLQYQNYARAEVLEYQKAGKNLTKTLFNPASPDYLGSAAVINSFTRDMNQQMRDKMSTIHGQSAGAGTSSETVPGPNGTDIQVVNSNAPTTPSVGVRQQDLIEKGNIDLDKRPVVDNGDGSISTVDSMSFSEDGKEILIPKVIVKDGRAQVVSNDEAIIHYRQTGENLGKFASVAAADKYAKDLHNAQELEYGAKYRTKEELQKDVKANRIARYRAEQIAIKRGWMQPSGIPAAPGGQ